jgi:SAM-dependent methyltransferase
MGFQDHFSGHADTYARARPTYPADLFAWLASQTKGHALAWDCGAGSGQATIGLAGHYAQVVGTDASAAQIGQAVPHPRITWRVARENESGLADRSTDLVIVAQALHWFDAAAFFAEARRILADGGLLAVWSYGLLQVDPAIDAVINRFYREEVGPFWPPERRLVESGYRTLAFPFDEITPPPFAMEARLNLTGVLAYIETWSAVQRYRKERGADPLPALEMELLELWGEPGGARRVTWPLAIRAGRTTMEDPRAAEFPGR